MFKGKITVNGTMIGIVYNDNQYIKLGMKDLASQVIYEDIVQFTIQNHQGIANKIIRRKKQPFIGIVSKITSKCLYLHLPLLNPCSSIPIPLSRETLTPISQRFSNDLTIGDNVLGWIDLDGCKILYTKLSDEELITKYHSEFSKMDVFDYLPKINKNVFHTPKDLTYLETFHIDPSGCVDIDDFMSIDLPNRKVYIHIIDITRYIPPGSPQDQYGVIYGNTWYFPTFALHLYPDTSSIYKTDNGEKNLLYCITMEITFQNDTYKVDFYKSIIKNSYDFTYSEIQEIFDGKNHPLKQSLDWSLETIGKFYLPNESIMRRLYWRIDNMDKIKIEYENELMAHRFINGWMVFYNSWIAENVKIKGQLLPQRHHPVTSVAKIVEMGNIPKEVQHIVYMKQFRQAEYKNTTGHFGLNREFYTHSTSPLRRYFDRWIQYMYTYDFWTSDERLLEHLNQMEKLSERIREWHHRQTLMKYIEQNKDKEWESYVIKIHPKGVEYYIYDIQEFIYHPLNDKVLGQKVFLKLIIDRKSIPIIIVSDILTNIATVYSVGNVRDRGC